MHTCWLDPVQMTSRSAFACCCVNFMLEILSCSSGVDPGITPSSRSCPFGCPERTSDSLDLSRTDASNTLAARRARWILATSARSRCISTSMITSTPVTCSLRPH